MGRICAIGHCTSKTSLRLPKNEIQCKRWLVVIMKTRKDPPPIKFFICDKHFQESNYHKHNVLSEEAIPTLNLHQSSRYQAPPPSPPKISSRKRSYSKASTSVEPVTEQQTPSYICYRNSTCQTEIQPVNSSTANTSNTAVQTSINELHEAFTILSSGNTVASINNYRRACGLPLFGKSIYKLVIY